MACVVAKVSYLPRIEKKSPTKDTTIGMIRGIFTPSDNDTDLHKPRWYALQVTLNDQ
jgi:hypothetical protein